MLAASSAACVATRSLGSLSSSCSAAPLVAAFSSSGTLLHSRLPTTLRQLAPTAFLATTTASSRVACGRGWGGEACVCGWGWRGKVRQPVQAQGLC
jgi:hypothetical protein